jgi:ssDNA-binding Zn-finger/Zn-ribbon topoisomerase 1
MRHAYHCHAPPLAAGDLASHASGGERRRYDPAEILDTARCPCCRTPLIARMGRRGPYFHCRCYPNGERPA